MKRRIILATALLVPTALAQADTVDYACKNRGRTFILKLDLVKNTITWKGDVYKTEEIECGKAGWHAKKDGVGFDFCTATKGVADFELNGVVINCDQKR